MIPGRSYRSETVHVNFVEPGIDVLYYCQVFAVSGLRFEILYFEHSSQRLLRIG